MKAVNLEAYLKRSLAPSSVKIYHFEIERFIQFIGEEQAPQARHKDVLRYLQHLRNSQQKPKTIRRILICIKKYYNYLLEKGVRDNHPCRYLSLRDQETYSVQVQDLLSINQLESLEQHLKRRVERYEYVGTRNQIILSLLLHQALLIGEMVGLRLEKIDLENAQIHIDGTVITNARILPLTAPQIMLFHQYLKEVRPVFLSRYKGGKNPPQDAFLLCARGTAETGHGIEYLCKTLRKAIPEKRISATTIRQSVIAKLLKKGNNLRAVQTFAGHKVISTTERYDQSNLELLQQNIKQFHPLK